MARVFCLSFFLLGVLLCSAQSDYKTYYEKAKGLEKTKDYSGAVVNYTIAIKTDSTGIGAYYHRGMVKFQIPDFAGAIQDFNKTIELCSNIAVGKESAEMRAGKFYANSYFYRAEAEFRIFKYRLAIIDYSQAMLKAIDSMGDAYNGRGRAKKRLADYYHGEYTDAISDFDKGIQLEPHKVFGYYHRGTAEYNAKNYEAALKDFTQSVSMDNTDADKYFWLAMVQSKLKSFAIAVSNFSKAIELNPYMDAAYENRGLAEIELNRYDEAHADLTKAAKLKSRNSSTTNSFPLGPE